MILISCGTIREKIHPKITAITESVYTSVTIFMGDEPTGNLDSLNAENVFQIFKKLKKEQELSLLVVTRDYDFAKRTDRIIEMEDGRISSDGS